MLALFIIIGIVCFIIGLNLSIDKKDEALRERSRIKRRDKDLTSDSFRGDCFSDSLDYLIFFDELGGTVRFDAKGLYYRPQSCQLRAKILHKGDSLFLEREYDNPVDRFAVGVFTEDKYMIGYVPVEYSESIAMLLSKGYNIKCEVDSKSPHEIPYIGFSASYESFLLKKLNDSFNEKWGIIDLKSTFKTRIKYENLDFSEENYKETLSIKGSYLNCELFFIAETILLVSGDVETIKYRYYNNISNSIFEIAKEYESYSMLDEAIEQYKKCIDIKEQISKSSIRLSILYRKKNDLINSVNILKTAYPLAEEMFEGKPNIQKLKVRLEKLDDKDYTTNTDLRTRIKLIKSNIQRTKKSIDKATLEGKTNIINKAKERLRMYEEELAQLSKQ